MQPLTKFVSTAALFSIGLAALCAQDAPKPTAGTAPSMKAVFLNQLGDTEKKLVSLAEATPQDKMAWRPAEGVRSNSEVFLHEAGANYLFMGFLGAKMPEGLDKNMEKTVTDKAKIVQALKDSFAHVRQTVTGLSDADMNKEAKMFGRVQSYQAILFIYANHMHEHLGQLIAYARQNGVVPPWSKKES